jgi:hypothetical protein
VIDSRALIRGYRESEWRSARFDAIRSLGRFTDGRSFQFLVEIIENNADLAEQELALLSLSQRKNRVASAFLRKFRGEAPDTLRAVVAYAIGQAQIYDLGPLLLEDFDQALSKQDMHWLKNLVLALGELKEFQATPKLHALLSKSSTESDLVLSTLLALGRLERDPEAMTPYSVQSFGESLVNQVFQSALSQIQIRSQFKLEDYLTKIFELPKPHPALPLELKAFDEEEVKIGLSLFDIKTYWERYLFACRGLSRKVRLELLPEIFKASGDTSAFLEKTAVAMAGLDNTGLGKTIEALCGKELDEESLRLKFIEAFAEEIDFVNEANRFLKAEVSAEIQMRFLNLWHETALTKTKSVAKKEFSVFAQKSGLKDEAYARLVRAAAEQGLEVPEISSNLASKFANASLRSSLLLYAERFALPKTFDLIQALPKSDLELLGVRILAVIENLTEHGKLDTNRKALIDLLKSYEGSTIVDVIVGVLRVLRFTGFAEFEKFAAEKTRSTHPLVELNAIIALKRFTGSREASERLVEKLESKEPIVRGRALDALCAHTTLLAKRGVIQFLTGHLSDDEVVDKIYRSFDPENKGGEEFVKAIHQVLIQNPDHPQWEKLVSLKDRLAGSTTQEASTLVESSPEVAVLDARLKILIPKFDSLDSTTKFALRAAEQPFVQTELGAQQPIDKAPTVLEYCKALDLILEKNLGQKLMFPKLDRELHDFQTLWHRVGFGEDYPQIDKVLLLLGLKGKIAPDQFPLHKAKMMCGTFFNGKILQDRFKIFDGLRAWAVILLIFTRKIPLATGAVGPMLKLAGSTDDQVIGMAKKLMSLQDLRNPAAHRQTYTDLAMVENIRAEAVSLINTILA